MSEEQKPVGDEPKAKKKRRKGIDPKHLKVVRGRARGMTLQEAGEAVGYPEKSARQAAWKAMQTVKATAAEVFDKHGLTLDSLAEDVNRLRHAKETKFFAKDGVVIETKEVEAHHIQVKAVDIGLQVQGAYKKPEDVSTTPQSAPVVINLAFLNADRAEAILAAQLPGGSDR